MKIEFDIPPVLLASPMSSPSHFQDKTSKQLKINYLYLAWATLGSWHRPCNKVTVTNHPIPGALQMPRRTDHSARRCAQRGFHDKDVRYVFAHGRKIHRTGITFYFLGRKDIPREDWHQEEYRRMEGTTLLVAENGAILTVYKNRNALQSIKRKAKRRSTRWRYEFSDRL